MTLVQNLDWQHTATKVPVPRVERAFLVFSIAVTLLQYAVWLPPLTSILERLTPYAGWVFGLPYMTAAWMWPSVYQARVRTVQTTRVTLSVQCLILLIYAAYGVADFVMFHSLRNDANPMLRYSPVRPVWTVLIPVVWAAALWRARPHGDEEA